MIALILTIVLSFITINLFGHTVHWALHQSWSSYFNKAHMNHHMKQYPPEDYLSEKYRHAGKDSTPKFFVLAALPMLSAVFAFWWFGVISLSLMIVAYVIMFGVGLLDNYLHDAFHIKNHWLTRTPVVKVWFARWVQFHYLHHVNMGTNYGIFNFMWDKVFNTFWKDETVQVPDIKESEER